MRQKEAGFAKKKKNPNLSVRISWWTIQDSNSRIRTVKYCQKALKSTIYQRFPGFHSINCRQLLSTKTRLFVGKKVGIPAEHLALLPLADYPHILRRSFLTSAHKSRPLPFPKRFPGILLGFPAHLSCRRVGVDLLDDLADAHPDGEIGKNLHDAALICKRRLLQDRQILHHAVVDDVLHDLVDEIDLESTGKVPVRGLYAAMPGTAEELAVPERKRCRPC